MSLGRCCVDCIIGLFWIRYCLLFLLAVTRLRRKLGQNLSPNTVPQYNSAKHRPSFSLNFKIDDVTRDDSYWNTAFQCWNNVATMLQRRVALKIVVANRLV